METQNNSEVKEEIIIKDDAIMNPEKNLFCLDCLQIPEYKIKINKNRIKLIHSCNKKVKETFFDSEIKTVEFPQYNCSYCQKKCNSCCIQCKEHICISCQANHIPDENPETDQNYFFDDDLSKEKQFICAPEDMQYLCKTHFLKYQFFCPLCRINLCYHCHNYHYHINCYPLLEYKVVIKHKSCPTPYPNDVISNLGNLCKLFELCYMNALKNKKMTCNIIMNYYLIDDINKYISKYKNKATKKDTILSTIFDNEKKENHLCDYFYNEQFKKNYSFLIDSADNGNYEYFFKMQVIKEFYQKEKRYNENCDWNDKSFYSSLKGKIDYFRSQYHYIKEMISTLNLNIQANYSKKEIENLKLLINVYETDINLLKKINMSLLYKFDFQFRRKVGNLLADLIILNYSELMDKIKESDFIVMETIISLRKKLSQIKDLSGPEEIKNKYENDLKSHYTAILEKASLKVREQLENIRKQIPVMKIIEEKDSKIQFHPSSNENHDINEAIILNLFFNLRLSFSSIFNDSIHNKTEQINSQIKEEIEDFQKTNLLNTENETELIIPKEDLLIQKNEEKLCSSFYERINEFKNNLNIKDDLTKANNENILKLFEPIKQHNYIEDNINEFKSDLEKLFKNYKFDDSADIKTASKLFFNGDILDMLMEKKTYHNFKSLKNEIKSQDLEDAKNELLNSFAKVEPLIDEYLEALEGMKNKSLLYIKQFENNIEINKNKIYENNPFKFLEKYKNVILFDIISHDSIKNAYFYYLIHFYFCAQDALRYLKELKMKYNESKLIIGFKNNFEKLLLLKIFNSEIKYEEHDNLKQKWSKLKTEENFIEGNTFLNKKIKEYVQENDETKFLEDLSNISKLKSGKINLLLNDPQNVIIKAFWIQNGIPLKIPEGLNVKK